MYGIVMFMVSALAAGVVGTAPREGVSYTVRDVYSVDDATFFLCRLRDYVQPTEVRFSVRLRNIEDAADPNTAIAGRRFLFERLTNARRIKLHHVEDRGYFRLIADVRVDGDDIAAEMADYGLVRRVSFAESKTEPQERPDRHFFEPLREGDEKPPVQPVVTSRESLKKRMSQTADLSRIVSDTTLQEALRIVADAAEPRLPILILWNDLEHNALVQRDMPLGIEGFGRMRLDKALELILRAASSNVRLLAVAEGGVLTIATDHAGLFKPRTGVYPAADILSAPSGDRSEQTSGIGGASMR